MGKWAEKLGINVSRDDVGSGVLRDAASGEGLDVQDRQGNQIVETSHYQPLSKEWREANPDDWWMSPQYHAEKDARAREGVERYGMTEQMAGEKADVMMGSRVEGMAEGAKTGAKIGGAAGPAGAILGGVGGAMLGATVGDVRAESRYDDYLADKNSAAMLGLSQESQQRAAAEAVQAQAPGQQIQAASYDGVLSETDQTLSQGLGGSGGTAFDQWHASRYGR